MHKTLLPAVLSTAISISPSFADTREEVLEAFNTVLETGQQTTVFWNSQIITLSHWWLRYTLQKEEKSWCRNLQKYFDMHQGEVNASFCASIHSSSHELSYPLITNKNIDLRFGGGITEYSNPRASIALWFSHPDVVTYSGKVSKIIGDTLYDPFISANLQWNYPMGEYIAYANLQWKYWAYTDMSQIEVWVKREFSKGEVSVAIGEKNFGVHGWWGEWKIANTLFGWTSWYIMLKTEYCPRSNICANLSADHGVSGVWKWQTQLNVWIGVRF